MTTNSVTISHRLEKDGVPKQQADSFAEIIVDFGNETFATKADLAEAKGELKADIAGLEKEFVRLEGKIDTQAGDIRLLKTMMVGLYVGLVLLFVAQILT